ncbi:MAG: single-strand DNA-binding protein [Parcubacteria group bacterium Licking1014_1]|nr:MAG: single-strand DNA-binding protein [Parcubacteria group bacterium Licking1014_1]
MNLNKAFILGNVTRDPEVRALPSGQQVTNFGVATNRFYTDSSGQKKQDAEFHNVVAFGKLADISSRYLAKGSMVLVEGRIKTRSWQNSSGLKQYRTEIIADNIQLAPKSMGGTTQNRPFSNPEIETKNPPAGGEEIPVIEENYAPPAITTEESQVQNNQPEAKTVSFEGDASDEIDVRDIPF